MTNYELWRLYTKRLHAPKQFLDAAFYYTIGAALERRVWIGGGAAVVYPNQYVLLCADAGVGKGLASGAAKALLDSLADPKNPEKPFLSKGPDSGSYEALIHRLADGTRPSRYTDASGTTRSYGYSCLRLELDEFMSFFHKDADNAVKFFCSMWSGVDFERDTLGRGTKPLANPLLNFIAGTTPQDMKKLQRCDIMGTGFDRRIIIVYAATNEFEQFLIRDFAPDELAASTQLSHHVEKLAKICGKCTFSDEAKTYAAEMWKDTSKRNVNLHPTIASFNANKATQWQKYSLAIHFSEGDPAQQLRTPISAETVHAAIKLLHSYEILRHHAYDYTAVNELAIVAKSIHHWLLGGPRTQAELISRYYDQAKIKDLDDVIEYLVASGRVKQEGEIFTAN